MGRFSPSSFLIGFLAAGAVVALPASAAVTSVSSATTATVAGFDGTTPSLTVTPLQFVPGTTIEATSPLSGCANYPSNVHYQIPLDLKWSGSDPDSGMAAYDVYVNYGEERPEVLNTQQTTLRLRAEDVPSPCGGGDSSYKYRIVARDEQGNSASSGYSAPNVAWVWQEDGTNAWQREPLGVAKTGTWRVSPCACSDGGKTLFSTVSGSSVTYYLPSVGAGSDLAVVMGKNSNRAPVAFSVDGGPVQRVDTYSATPQNRMVVWRAPLTTGTHTLRITNSATGSARSRIDVDAVMIAPGRVFG